VVSPVPEATVARCAIAGHDITSSVRTGVPLRSDSVAAAETPVGDRLRPPSAWIGPLNDIDEDRRRCTPGWSGPWRSGGSTQGGAAARRPLL